ncbi:hypothetical protein XENOCAPTIV_006987 [Xenoophorus captivus]|uniref:EF-hand domain-containing protein n=1 Tax=Xenoophorus captivus TaxID=1517983 RepID=A0ABV0RXB8_9TELE
MRKELSKFSSKSDPGKARPLQSRHQRGRGDFQREPKSGATNMGNAESGCGGGSGEEEDMETESPGFAEDNLASAAIGGGVGGNGGTGSGRNGRGSNNPPATTEGPPSPAVLLEQVKLREAAARVSDSGVTIHESVLSGNEGVLIRWLEDRLTRGEESVNVEQFCEMLESRDAPRNECEEAFGQFDAEGDGAVDIESIHHEHVVRLLSNCSLFLCMFFCTGFVDIFSKSKDRLGAHASKVLKFLHRNRIPSSAIPFPILEGYNSICTMRSSVVQDFLEFLLQKEKDVVLRRLAIAVASNDHSYMPQLVSVSVGKTRRSLQEIRDIRIPSNVTGYVALLENANITHPCEWLCCVSPDAEMTLLAFALARGSVAKILQALSCISEHLQTKYKASSLIVSMASVRLRLLYRNGKPLQLHLQACDVKSKEEKSGPENMLTESSTGDGFLTESGRKKASVILSTEDQSNFQVTQMKIKVR